MLCEQIGIGRQRALRRQNEPIGIDSGFSQRTGLHVLLGCRKALFEHAGDLGIRQPISRFDVNMGLYAAALLFRADLEQAVGIDREGDANSSRTGNHRRDATQFKARQTAAVCDQITLTLNHVQRQRGLPVLVGREILCHRRRNGLIARHDALDQSPHRLNAQRQGINVEKKQIVVRGVASQLVG